MREKVEGLRRTKETWNAVQNQMEKCNIWRSGGEENQAKWALDLLKHQRQSTGRCYGIWKTNSEEFAVVIGLLEEHMYAASPFKREQLKVFSI